MTKKDTNLEDSGLSAIEDERNRIDDELEGKEKIMIDSDGNKCKVYRYVDVLDALTPEEEVIRLRSGKEL